MRFTELIETRGYKDGGSMMALFETESGALVYLRINLRMFNGGFRGADTFGGYDSLLFSSKDGFFSSPEAERLKRIYAVRKKMNELVDEIEDLLFPVRCKQRNI